MPKKELSKYIIVESQVTVLEDTGLSSSSDICSLVKKLAPHSVVSLAEMAVGSRKIK